jgi:hypothetical protein
MSLLYIFPPLVILTAIIEKPKRLKSYRKRRVHKFI